MKVKLSTSEQAVLERVATLYRAKAAALAVESMQLRDLEAALLSAAERAETYSAVVCIARRLMEERTDESHWSEMRSALAKIDPQFP